MVWMSLGTISSTLCCTHSSGRPLFSSYIIVYDLFSFLFVHAARKIFRTASPLLLCLGGLLYASHPVHCDAIASVVGRAEALSGLFIMLSFLTYASAIKAHDHTQFSYLRIILSIVLSAVALLCKEQGITVLAVNGAYDFSVVCQYDVVGFFKLLPGYHGDNSKKTNDATTVNSIPGLKGDGNNKEPGAVKGPSTDVPKPPRWPLHFKAFLTRMLILLLGLAVVGYCRYRIGPGDTMAEEQTNRMCDLVSLYDCALMYGSGQLRAGPEDAVHQQVAVHRTPRVAADLPQSTHMRLVRLHVRITRTSHFES